MQEEDDGVVEDAAEEADGPFDADAAELKVSEAAELEGFEVGVCDTLAMGRDHEQRDRY